MRILYRRARRSDFNPPRISSIGDAGLQISTLPGRNLQPILAGVVTALVGFASSFAVVLKGLGAAGASEAQAASGLMALAIARGLAGVALSVALRQPISVAWSTPGAALLASTGAVAGGWPAAVGA